MISVIYHATRPGGDHDLYRSLFAGFRENVGGTLVHLTCDGQETFGDLTLIADLDPKEVVFNREYLFRAFLRDYALPTEVYWFTEPDARVSGEFGLRDGVDAALIYREGDKVPMCPAFRLARKSALPLFDEFVEAMVGKDPEWDGDSDAFTEVWQRMGKPKVGLCEHQDRLIEMLPYSEYVCRFSPGPCANYKGESKRELVDHRRVS